MLTPTVKGGDRPKIETRIVGTTFLNDLEAEKFQDDAYVRILTCLCVTSKSVKIEIHVFPDSCQF